MNFKRVLFLLITTPSLPTILSFAVPPRSQPPRVPNRPLFSSTSEEAERLRASAFKLRQEADALREKLGPPSTAQQRQQASKEENSVVVFKNLKDSSWELTYRFSKDDDTTQEPTATSRNYSGKLTVTFKSDGYTDLISHVPSGRDTLVIQKVWGWDEDEQDDLQYLLFSVSADSDYRFYWQARIHVDTKTGSISLADGTISIKKNAVPGFWGVLDGSGILAQFYRVGNFGGKPVRVTTASESKLL